MEVKYTKQAGKTLISMNEPIKSRVIRGIDLLPHGDIKKLHGYLNTFRLRVGDYRVLFSIENDIITIQSILPRGEVYKR